MMRRNQFIRFCAAAAALALSPFRAIAGRRTDKGFFVQNGKDRFNQPLNIFGSDNLFAKVSGSDTDGDLYILDTTRVKPGGPPLHFHYSQDEWWYVISGEFLIRVGENTFHAKAGDSVFGPRGIPHTFAKIGEGEAKIVLAFQPAGKMEEFFKASSKGMLSKMSDEEKQQFRKDHGFEHVGAPIELPLK